MEVQPPPSHRSLSLRLILPLTQKMPVLSLLLQYCSVALPGKYILVIFPSAGIKVCVSTQIELTHMHRCVGILGKKTLDICSPWLIPEELRYTEKPFKIRYTNINIDLTTKKQRRYTNTSLFPQMKIVGSEKNHHRQSLVASACPAKTGISNCVFITVFLKHSLDRLLPNLIWTEYTSC